MDKEEHIEKTQLENQLKFAAQLDLFTANPEMIKKKEELSIEILKQIAVLTDYENIIKETKAKITQLAIKAIELQNQGIFWDDPNYSVCKAPKKKDVKAMFAQLNTTQISIYDNLVKQTKAVKTSLFKTIKPIYLATNPSIKRHGEKEYGEESEEE
jgi:hypothetical protein